MSNKTLKENAKKTKSAPKVISVIVIALVAALVLSFIATISISDEEAAIAPPTSSTTCKGLETRDGCYELERLDTESVRTLGLSGRDSLAQKSGMLFVFDQPARQCFWMKEMKFNIDMIWLDDSKTITRIESDVSPSTYPESFCKDNTKYVLELNANDAQKLQLATGQRLTF